MKKLKHGLSKYLLMVMSVMSALFILTFFSCKEPNYLNEDEGISPWELEWAIKISIEPGDTNITILDSSPIVAQKGTKWGSLRSKAEKKLSFISGYEFDSWVLGGRDGAAIDDGYVLDKHSTIFARSKPISSGDKITIIIKSHEHIKAIEGETKLEINKNKTWAEVRNQAESFVEADNGYEIDKWMLGTPPNGVELKDSHLFQDKDTIFATSKKVSEASVTITIQGDSNVIVSRPNIIRENIGSVWGKVKKLVEAKVTVIPGYLEGSWYLGQGGPELKNDYVFNEREVTVYLTSVPLPPNKSHLVLTNDSNLIISKPTVLLIDRNAVWSSLKDKVEKKVTALPNYKLKSWHENGEGGKQLLDDHVFKNDVNTIYAKSKSLSGGGTEKIKIKIAGDTNIIIPKPNEIEENSGVKWADIKAKIEEKVSTIPGYLIGTWHLGTANGKEITDEYVFEEETTVYAVSVLLPPDKSHVVLTHDEHFILSGNNLLLIDRNDTWANVKVKAEQKIKALPDYKLKGWYINGEGGERLTSSYIFKDEVTTIFAKSKRIKGGTDSKFKITLSGDTNITISEPKQIEKTGEVKWADIKAEVDKKVSVRPGYLSDKWHLNNGKGEIITDDFVFDEAAVIYLTSKPLPPNRSHVILAHDEHLQISEPKMIEVERNSTWKQVRAIAEPKVTVDPGYRLYRWFENDLYGRKIRDTYIFNKPVNTIFAKSLKADKKVLFFIRIEVDDDILIIDPEVHGVIAKEGETWADIKDKALSKISVKPGYRIDKWQREDGKELKDDYVFDENTDIYVSSKPLPSNLAHLVLKHDEHLTITEPTRIEINKNSTWAEVKDRVNDKVGALKDYEFKRWHVNDKSGAELTDNYTFTETVNTIYAESERKVDVEPPSDGLPPGKVYLALTSDKYLGITKPKYLVIDKDSTWAQVKDKAEAKIKPLPGYRLLQWRDYNASGNVITDNYKFSALVNTIYGESQKTTTDDDLPNMVWLHLTCDSNLRIDEPHLLHIMVDSTWGSMKEAIEVRVTPKPNYRLKKWVLKSRFHEPRDLTESHKFGHRLNIIYAESEEISGSDNPPPPPPPQPNPDKEFVSVTLYAEIGSGVKLDNLAPPVAIRLKKRTGTAWKDIYSDVVGRVSADDPSKRIVWALDPKGKNIADNYKFKEDTTVFVKAVVNDVPQPEPPQPEPEPENPDNKKITVRFKALRGSGITIDGKAAPVEIEFREKSGIRWKNLYTYVYGRVRTSHGRKIVWSLTENGKNLSLNYKFNEDKTVYIRSIDVSTPDPGDPLPPDDDDPSWPSPDDPCPPDDDDPSWPSPDDPCPPDDDGLVTITFIAFEHSGVTVDGRYPPAKIRIKKRPGTTWNDARYDVIGRIRTKRVKRIVWSLTPGGADMSLKHRFFKSERVFVRAVDYLPHETYEADTFGADNNFLMNEDFDFDDDVNYEAVPAMPFIKMD